MHQSTNHLMMLEPIDFGSNPQTKETNLFQHDEDIDAKEIQRRAVQELRAFRDLLVGHGVAVTTIIGQKGCPDDIFCNNWVSTHAGKRMVLYPMLNENRQKERRPDLDKLLRRMYTDIQDFTQSEKLGKALESTGALCMDRVNKIAYQALSDRSDRALGASWCQMNGFEHVPFETDHKGKPVYHADVVMWIGTDIAGICSEALKDRSIIHRLKEKRDVIEFSATQMEAFCGNSLEVIGRDGERMLVMSLAGYDSLSDEQKSHLHHYYHRIIKPCIKTIEYYGGGSARCMLLELF